jgi:hypothetical protein
MFYVLARQDRCLPSLVPFPETDDNVEVRVLHIGHLYASLYAVIDDYDRPVL